jgi:hypothetical protein
MQVFHDALKSKRIRTRTWPVAAWLRNGLERTFRRIDWREIARLLAMREDRPS